MMEQLILIEIASLPNLDAIRCSKCSTQLHDLDDLHQHCEVTGIIHETATISDRNTLYRKSFRIVLA